jgi:hypothetical protein
MVVRALTGTSHGMTEAGKNATVGLRHRSSQTNRIWVHKIFGGQRRTRISTFSGKPYHRE